MQVFSRALSKAFDHSKASGRSCAARRHEHMPNATHLPVPRVRCRPRGRSLRSCFTATWRPVVRQVALCTVPKLPTPSSEPSSKRASKSVGRPSSVPRPGAAGGNWVTVTWGQAGAHGAAAAAPTAWCCAEHAVPAGTENEESVDTPGNKQYGTDTCQIEPADSRVRKLGVRWQRASCRGGQSRLLATADAAGGWSAHDWGCHGFVRVRCLRGLRTSRRAASC